MSEFIVSRYKTPFLICIALSVVLIALRAYDGPTIFTQIIVGTILGLFLLDLDFIIYAYFTDTSDTFSQTLRGYIKHRDFNNALRHIHYHSDDIKEKILNSALFQIVLAGAIVLVCASSANMFTKALVTSLFINSIYRQIEAYYKNKSDDWFWAIKNKPDKNIFILYTIGLIGVFIMSLNFIR